MEEVLFSLKNPTVDVWRGPIYVFDGHVIKENLRKQLLKKII